MSWLLRLFCAPCSPSPILTSGPASSGNRTAIHSGSPCRRHTGLLPRVHSIRNLSPVSVQAAVATVSHRRV